MDPQHVYTVNTEHLMHLEPEERKQYLCEDGSLNKVKALNQHRDKYTGEISHVQEN